MSTTDTAGKTASAAGFTPAERAEGEAREARGRASALPSREDGADRSATFTFPPTRHVERPGYPAGALEYYCKRCDCRVAVDESGQIFNWHLGDCACDERGSCYPKLLHKMQKAEGLVRERAAHKAARRLELELECSCDEPDEDTVYTLPGGERLYLGVDAEHGDVG